MTRQPATDDDFEEMLAGYDRIIHDKALQQQLLDAGLLVRIDEAEAAARDPEAVRLREALNDLVEASHIIVINEVPSNEAWVDFNKAYDAGLAALAASPEPAETCKRCGQVLDDGQCPGTAASPEPTEALDALLALSDKIGARYLDHDWNAPNLILRSDGSGKLVAKAFEPYVANFIVAAARYLARLQQPTEERP